MMKAIFFAGAVALIGASPTQAATLTCASGTEASTPNFHFSASFNEDQSVERLENVRYGLGDEQTLSESAIQADSSYRPRGARRDLNRFVLKQALLIEQSDLDGYVHHVILPKHVSSSATQIDGIVAFTTDSYHDGIISYGKMPCSVTHDRLSASLSARDQKLACTPTQPESSFEKLDLSIDAAGRVSGTYMGYENQESRTVPVSLNDESVWMTLDPVQARFVNGKIRMVFDFHGRMGSDEDIYTLAIDPKSGEATMKIKSMIDCGDGRYHSQPAESYRCLAL